MTGDLVLALLPADGGAVFAVTAAGVVYALDGRGGVAQAYAHGCGLTRACAAHSDADGALLALCGADKRLCVVRVSRSADGGWLSRVLRDCALPKAATCASFSGGGDDLELIVGDKFGDVLRVSPRGDDAPRIFAGCVSIVTAIDTFLLRDAVRVVAMADRDEKVRLVRLAHPHNIEGFLLSHTAYVSGVAALADSAGGAPRLVTAGGDNRVLLWRVPPAGGTLCAPAGEAAIVEGAAEVDPISLRACGTHVAVLVAGESCVRLFEAAGDTLESRFVVSLDAEATALAVIGDVAYVATLKSVCAVSVASGRVEASHALPHPAADVPRAALAAHLVVVRKRSFERSRGGVDLDDESDGSDPGHGDASDEE